jgi:hypothetical protein
MIVVRCENNVWKDGRTKKAEEEAEKKMAFINHFN